MNFLKKGPQIKLPKLKLPSRGSKPKKPSSISTFSKPDIKVPTAISDIYYELQDRHLLPLVVFLLVAIVAVPIALSEGPSAEAEAEAETAASASATPASKNARVVVAKSIPGLRDYRRRLAHQTPKNPFEKPGEVAEVEKAIGEFEGQIESALNGESPESAEPAETGGTPEVVPGTVTHTFTFYSWEIDVRVVPVSANGKPSKAEPSVRNNLPELTMLPGRDTPALVFIQPSKDGEKALMLVSSNVNSIFGDNTCVLGGETCQMLALEKGVPETLVYGGNERVFRIELQDIRLVATEKRHEAPLGTPKPGDNSTRPAVRPAEAQAELHTTE